ARPRGTSALTAGTLNPAPAIPPAAILGSNTPGTGTETVTRKTCGSKSGTEAFTATTPVAVVPRLRETEAVPSGPVTTEEDDRVPEPLAIAKLTGILNTAIPFASVTLTESVTLAP